MSNPEFPDQNDPSRFDGLHYGEEPQPPDFGAENPADLKGAIKQWQANMVGHAVLTSEVDDLQANTHDEQGKPLPLDEVKAKYPQGQTETANEPENSNVIDISSRFSSEAAPDSSDAESFEPPASSASRAEDSQAEVVSLADWKARKEGEDAPQSEPDTEASDRYDGLHYAEAPRHPSYPPPEAYADPEKMDKFRQDIAEHKVQVANQQALREEIDSLQADTHDQYRRPLPLGEIKTKFAMREFHETMDEVGEIQRSVIDQENLRRQEQGQEPLTEERHKELSDFVANSMNEGHMPRVVGGSDRRDGTTSPVLLHGHVPTSAEADSQTDEQAPSFIYWDRLKGSKVRLMNDEALPRTNRDSSDSEGFGIDTFTVPLSEDRAGRLTESEWKERTGKVQAAIEATSAAPAETTK